MASTLGSELTCPICLELFDDPVTLSCMHSYCRKCVESLLHSSGWRRLQCPECREEAILDNTGLQKLPRNFTLANIVAKYRNTDKVPQIPCDLCEEKMQQNAVKSCRECRLSYCMQCLILHPQRGALAKHSLIEPQELEGLEKNIVCLKCAMPPEKDSKLEGCRRDHGNDVMDVETAKIKLRSKLQGDYVIIEKTQRDYLEEIYKTTETLNDITRKADTTRRNLKQKCHDKTDKIVVDFKQILQEYDSGIKEVKDKGQGHLIQLKNASFCFHDILPKMKKALQKAYRDLDFKIKQSRKKT